MSTPRGSTAKSIGHYILMKTIGEGTFGKVKLGTHILTGERVAVKVLEKERIVDTADVERVAREIHILKLIRHPHMIQLYEIIETPRQLYLIMEYACGGELFDYIVQHGRAKEREACRFLHQILAGVEKVHKMRVVHRDLKPENLLLDEHQDIKIVDFGLSNTYQEGQLLQTACGSPCYAAPEMIAGHKYVPSRVDIWSCGVILFALVCGYLPFEDQNHAELYSKILNAQYEMPNFVSEEVADLITRMLTTDPEKRITLDGIREHVWYRQIPEASIQDCKDDGVVDEEILEQLESYGFPRDYAVKCLENNKHNHVTTTYYLLREKRRRSRVKGSSSATNLHIADLDATGLEPMGEEPEPPLRPAPVTPAVVASVATPSRSAHRADATMACGTPPVQSGSSMHSAPVPKLNLGQMGKPGAAVSGGGAPHTGRGGGHQSARNGHQGYPGDGRSVSPAHSGRWPASPSHQTRRATTPRAPSASSRGRRSARGPEEAYEACAGGSRSPWGNNFGSWPEPTEVPLTARPRLQGNTPSRRAERPPGAPPAAWGQGPPSSRGRHVPHSARNGSRSARSQRCYEGGEDPGHASCEVTCHSVRHPRQIVQEVLRALRLRRISYRQVSSDLVLCKTPRVQLEIEVLQGNHGHVVRLSRVSGDVRLYKDVCAQLLNEMNL